MSRRPDTFIIGAPKSGTTALYGYLGEHPEVYMSPVKEPLYFCPDVRSGPGRRRYEYGTGEAAYLRLFAEARTEKRLGEATTRYLVSRQAAGLVAQFQPDAHAIAMLRNPIDMLASLHNERVSQGHEWIADLGQALAADSERVAGRLLPEGTNALGIVYRENAQYAAPLGRWFAALGRERVHVIVFDDFARDTAAEYRKVCQFLGVDPGFSPSSFEPRNASHRQRRWVRRVVDSRPGTWLTHDALGRIVGENRRARLALRFRHSRVNRRAMRREPVDPELRRSLEAEFRPDIERLSEMIGRDLVALWFGERSA